MPQQYKTVSFNAGTIIFSEGDVGDCAYIVQSGKVQVSKRGPNDKEVPLAVIGKGGIFGEMAMLDDKSRFATVSALEPVEVIKIDRDSFLGKLEGLDHFTNVLIKTLIGRLKKTSVRTTKLADTPSSGVSQMSGEPVSHLKVAVSQGGSGSKKPCNFNDVSFLLIDGNKQTRLALKSSLFQNSFREIRDISNIFDFGKEMTESFFDIVLLDTGQDEDYAFNMIRSTRHGEVGQNPFVTIISIVDSADPDTIRKMLDAGSDDIIVRPLSPGALVQRIERQVHNRQRFVVTHDYVGPDRFAGSANPSKQIPRFEVPNTLRLKSLGEAGGDRALTLVRAASDDLSRRKMECHVMQLEWLLDSVEEAMARGDSTMQVFSLMSNVVQDLSARMEDSSHVGNLPILKAMEGFTERASEKGYRLRSSELNELRSMTDSIASSVIPQRNSGAMGRQPIAH